MIQRSATMTIAQTARQARRASRQLAACPSERKNAALKAVRDALRTQSQAIIHANRADIEQAEQDNLSKPLLKRLKFDEDKISEACAGLDSLIALEDPVGKTLAATELDESLELYKVTCPIGVIGVIFESRPDALVQISSLCLKSGNAVLLKGGSEAARTNRVLAETITRAAAAAGLPDGWLGLLETRADVAAMLALDDDIDLIIPRGSNEFVRHIMDNTRIPVMGHADGICHVYVDAAADIPMAVKLTVDSKCQYVAVCNAAETLLVHQAVAADFLPKLKTELNAHGVDLRGCDKTRQIIDCAVADEHDWKTEYLDAVLSIRVVDSLEEAIEHINTYGSGHTDAIVTDDRNAAMQFMDQIDSADVFWNASTRFADGYRYGLGAEVGISTGKLHARGPVGMEGLLIYKWRLLGKGHIVADYTGAGDKPFTHNKLNKSYRM
ncbi:MAG TPA: glutamate-5-semialdehyde dehydrogenase [Phycisphaerales bacterium]|nr:glutamate-5-semialdehyde dehydrogenase [Phycisphaerales bacterium]